MHTEPQHLPEELGDSLEPQHLLEELVEPEKLGDSLEPQHLPEELVEPEEPLKVLVLTNLISGKDKINIMLVIQKILKI